MQESKDIQMLVLRQALLAKDWQSVAALSLVCKSFHNVLQNRVELANLRPLKTQWLEFMRGLCNEHSTKGLKNYFANTAVALQMSSKGPVGLSQKSLIMQSENSAARCAIFKRFNYLECQYLHLVQLAYENYEEWHGVLLEKLRTLLEQNACETANKFAELMKLSKEPNILKAEDQPEEYRVYLKAKFIFSAAAKDKPIHTVFPSRASKTQQFLKNVLHLK